MTKAATIRLATINCIELYGDLDIAIKQTSKSRFHINMNYISMESMFRWASEPVFKHSGWQIVWSQALHTKNNAVSRFTMSEPRIIYNKFKKMYIESKTT